MKSSNKRNIILGLVCVTMVAGMIFIPGVPAPTPLNGSTKTTDSTSVAPLTLAVVEKSTMGFKTGNLMAAKKVAVFFDPACPHCKDLWNANEALNRKDVSVTWIPVGVLQPQSVTVASKILSVLPDNQKAISLMQEHKNNFDKGGISGDATTTSKFKDKVRANSEVLTNYSTSIPFMITEIDGKTFTEKGGLTPDRWNKFIDTGVSQ